MPNLLFFCPFIYTTASSLCKLQRPKFVKIMSSRACVFGVQSIVMSMCADAYVFFSDIVTLPATGLA